MRRVILFLAAFVFTFTLTTGIAAQDDEVLRVDSSIVVVNATIKDANGSPVHGLKQNQFKILEDGVQQELTFFEAEETPFAAVILLDTSGSMESRLTLARAAAINFLAGLRMVDVAAVYTFDSKVSLIQDFSNSRDIADVAYDLKARGSTVMYDAIYQAAAVLQKRPEKRKAIIVLSDGADTGSEHRSEKALKAALAADALIYTIDMSPVGSNDTQRLLNQGVLKNFAEKTGGTFVPTPGGAALRDAFGKILDELRTQYTLAYQPSNVKKDGKWRALELRVAKSNLYIRTRKGYHAPKK